MKRAGFVGASQDAETSPWARQGRRVTGLSPEQQESLHRLLDEPVEFIDHPCFRKTSTEAWLYGEEADGLDVQPWCNAVVVPRDVRRRPRSTVLSPEQEARLFLQLNYARWRLCRVESNGRLRSRTALEMLRWAGRAEKARCVLVQVNMPLVLAMAKRVRLTSVDFAELISEGNMALMRSVDKFDCSRGFKFSTYACRAILKAFSRVALRTSRYRGHFPTEFDPALERSDYDERCRIVEESDCVSELRDIMARNLAALSEVERIVIVQRFALDAASPEGVPPVPKTLEEVGLIIGVTKERVRQIQNRALAKLRIALEQGILAA